MKNLLIILVFLFLCFPGISQKKEPLKIAQVDIFIENNVYQFQVTKLPILTEDETFELIFMLYVLENKEAEIIKKVKELYKSDIKAVKPKPTKSTEILKL